MTPYEALAHAFSTMPTGGFSTQPDSVAAFSAEAQWILALFMVLAGANFALMYRALRSPPTACSRPRRGVPALPARSSSSRPSR